MRKSSKIVWVLGAVAALAVVGAAAIDAWQPAEAQKGVQDKPYVSVQLVGEGGQATSLAALKGKWSLVLFGYMTCPDVCPTSLAYLAREVRDMGPVADAVRVAFVSVDPERDQSDALARYVHHFDPSFVAMTGTEDNLRIVSKALGAYFGKESGNGSAAGYLVTHSSSFFVFDPAGRFVKSLPAPHERGAVAREMIRLTGMSTH